MTTGNLPFPDALKVFSAKDKCGRLPEIGGPLFLLGTKLVGEGEESAESGKQEQEDDERSSSPADAGEAKLLHANGVWHEDAQPARAYAGDWDGDGDRPRQGAGVSVHLLLLDGGGVRWETVGQTRLVWVTITALRYGKMVERRHRGRGPRRQRLLIRHHENSIPRENISSLVHSAAVNN